MDKFASVNLTVGQLNAVVKKLGGEKGALALLRGEIIVVDKAAAPGLVQKTIGLGNGLYPAEILRAALIEEDFLIGPEANSLLDSPDFMFSTEPVEANLVVMSVGDLGFPNGANCGEIFARGETLSLIKNISECGPQLRLQHKFQLKGERLIIAMLSLMNTNGKPRLFAVERFEDDEHWLTDVDGAPDYLWGPKTKFVFQRRR